MEPFERTRVAAAVLALVAGVGAAPVTPDDERDPPPEPPFAHFVGVRNDRFEAGVRFAFALASSGLEQRPCADLLSDFRDGAGRALRAHLESRSGRPADYLGTLLFYDADRTLLCQSSLRIAGTVPGSHIVLLCGERFLRLETRDPAFAAALLLHETLHTLGLGEDPPSSAEITERVLARCGR